MVHLLINFAIIEAIRLAETFLAHVRNEIAHSYERLNKTRWRSFRPLQRVNISSVRWKAPT